MTAGTGMLLTSLALAAVSLWPRAAAGAPESPSRAVSADAPNPVDNPVFGPTYGPAPPVTEEQVAARASEIARQVS
ncbi:MAG: hypothetical protein ABI560_18740, partial [Myxococcales bacterium]